MTTCAELKAKILRTLERENDTRAASRVADWVSQAEEDIFARLRAPWLINVLSLTLDEDWEELPPGFLAVKSVLANWQGHWYEIGSLTSAQLEGRLDESSGAFGYCIENFSITVVPNMRPIDIRITAYLAEQALLADNDTNTTLARASNVYLYGACRHAAVFYGQDPGTYDVAFNGAVELANMQAPEWASGDGFVSTMKPRRRRIYVSGDTPP